MTPSRKKRGPIRIGKQPPQYNFFLNPYQDFRFTSCPKCDRKTGQRKLPLLIFVQQAYPVALNYTCRYCADCDLLIARRDEIEGHLTRLFAQLAPEVIGSDYLVIGTLDRADWKRGVQKPLDFDEMEEALHDFKHVWNFKVTGGWVKDT